MDSQEATPETARDAAHEATLDAYRKYSSNSFIEETAFTNQHPVSERLQTEAIQYQRKRHAELSRKRADRACDFLVHDPKFIEWEQHPGSTTIGAIGNLGVGKSVTASFVVDNLPKRALKIFYYCRSDGGTDPHDVLSVLLLSILNQVPELKQKFVDWHSKLGPQADFEVFDTFLWRILSSLSLPLIMVIDGLDHCGWPCQRAILELIKSASRLPSAFKFALFSRPCGALDNIALSLPRYRRVELASDLSRDRIIATRLVEMETKSLPKKNIDLAIDHLSSAAAGSALWMEHMMKLVQAAGDDYSDSDVLRERLEQPYFPSSLACSYDQDLWRNTRHNPKSEARALRALELLAVCKRPLTTAELDWATPHHVYGSDGSNVPWNDDRVDPSRTLDLVGPFLGVDRHEDKQELTVRLLHHSIKEYAIQQAERPPGSLGKPIEYPEVGPRREARIRIVEGNVLCLCLNYLYMDGSGEIPLFTAMQSKIESLPQAVALFRDSPEEISSLGIDVSLRDWKNALTCEDPDKLGPGGFYEYAACHWIDHFLAAGTARDEDMQKIRKLYKKGLARLKKWPKGHTGLDGD